MKVHLEYMAQLREAAKRSAESIEVPAACTLPALLDQVARQKGEEFRRLVLTDTSKPRPSLLVFVNSVWRPPSDTSPLPEDARVVLTTPLSGG